MDKAPNLNSLREKYKVSYKPTGSQLPSGQNNSHAKVARFGEACSESFSVDGSQVVILLTIILTITRNCYYVPGIVQLLPPIGPMSQVLGYTEAEL